MPLLYLVISRATGILFSMAAVFTSLNIFKKQPDQAQSGGLTIFEMGKLVIMAAAVLLGYRIIKEVFN